MSASTFRRAAVGFALSAGFLTPFGVALARQPITVTAPFEVSESQAGNYLSAYVADAIRDTLAAATYFREVLRRDPNNKDLLEHAFVASLSNGNFRQAYSYARRLLSSDRANGLAELVLSLEAFQGQHFDAACDHLKKAGSGRQRDVTAVLLTAWSYLGSGQPKQALDLIDKSGDRRLASLLDYHAGLIADLAGNSAEARKRLNAAYQAEKTSLRVVDAWGRFLARHGEADAARTVYQDFDKLLPRHPVVTTALADLASGKPLARLVSTPVEGAGEVLYGLGSIGSQDNDGGLLALIYLRMALALAPGNSMAIITLADVYERAKQGERAIEAYELVPETSPLRINADVQSSLILETLGRSDEALKHLNAIVKDHPKDVDALTALGNLQRSRKQYSDAVATYNRVIDEIQPARQGDWTLYYFRGIANERAKHWPPAEADFRKALELQPDQPLVLNYLGYSWVDKGLNLDEAFQKLRRAVELRPTDGYIIDSLGWAHYKLGHYDDALRELERAIQYKPGDPVINDHLGDAYWRAGRQLEAHFQWNHARDLNPDPEDLPLILKKIEHGLDDGARPAAAGADPAQNGG